MRDRAVSHPRSPSRGPAQFGSVLIGSASKVGAWCGRDAIFKISSICRRRDKTRVFECAFGVDETMCVSCGRNTSLQNALPIFPQRATSSFAPDAWSVSQSGCLVWAERYIFKKKACGVDETLVGERSLLRHVLRKRGASSVIMFGDELGR